MEHQAFSLIRKALPYILIPALALRGIATLSLHGGTWLERLENFVQCSFEHCVNAMVRLRDVALAEPETSVEIVYIAEVSDSFAVLLPQHEDHHVLWVLLWLWFTWLMVQRSFFISSCKFGAVCSLVAGALAIMQDLHPATAVALQATVSLVAAIPANICAKPEELDPRFIVIEVMWDCAEACITLSAVVFAYFLRIDTLWTIITMHAAILLSKIRLSVRKGHTVNGFYSYVAITNLSDFEDVEQVLACIIATAVFTLSTWLSRMLFSDTLNRMLAYSQNVGLGPVLGQVAPWAMFFAWLLLLYEQFVPRIPSPFVVLWPELLDQFLSQCNR